jgi:hypothetical protein
MVLRLLLVVGVVAGGVVGGSWATGPALAQGGDRFAARLAWVPTTATDRTAVTGKGLATATLSGRTLTINGTFEGLATAATLARLHEGVAKGARGRAVADLIATKATSGTISGAVTLTPQQLENLKQGKLYVQVHSEKGVAPDGANLWGWLVR